MIKVILLCKLLAIIIYVSKQTFFYYQMTRSVPTARQRIIQHFPKAFDTVQYQTVTISETEKKLKYF